MSPSPSRPPRPRKKPFTSTHAFSEDSDVRRAFVRVDFEKGAKVGIAGPTGESAYDALDLSVYGVSFLVPPDDADRFVEGMEIPALAFVIDGRQVSARGRVVYVRKGLAAGLAKVAVELTSVTTEDIWLLSKHVTRRAGLGKPLQLGEGAIRVPARRKKAAKKAGKKATKKTAKKAAPRKATKPRKKTARRKAH
jgi:hypothetical protein